MALSPFFENQSLGISILEPAGNRLDEKYKTTGEPNKKQRQIGGGHAQSLGRRQRARDHDASPASTLNPFSNP
jgi:hypothetical protein